MLPPAAPAVVPARALIRGAFTNRQPHLQRRPRAGGERDGAGAGRALEAGGQIVLDTLGGLRRRPAPARAGMTSGEC